MKNCCKPLILLLLSLGGPLLAQNNDTAAKVEVIEPVVDQSFFGPVLVENLKALNTKELEMCPMPFGNGIVFTATHSKARGQDKSWSSNKKYTDLYYAQKGRNGKFRASKPLKGKVNSALHDGMACFTNDGKVMYFTRNNKKGKSEDGVVDLKICRAELVGNEWTNVKDLPFNSKAFSNCHPSLSPDNQKMYFSSNRPGGLGGMDLYVSELKRGKWQDPVNLGSAINTTQNEIFPYSGPDGNFYFSSDGHPGEGGLDLFLSLGPEMGDWGRVENLGPAFNSPSDDFGLIINASGDAGYFSSSRAGGSGRDDIYQWGLEEPTDNPLTNRFLSNSRKTPLDPRDTDTPYANSNNQNPISNNSWNRNTTGNGEMENMESLTDLMRTENRPVSPNTSSASNRSSTTTANRSVPNTSTSRNPNTMVNAANANWTLDQQGQQSTIRPNNSEDESFDGIEGAFAQLEREGIATNRSNNYQPGNKTNRNSSTTRSTSSTTTAAPQSLSDIMKAMASTTNNNTTVANTPNTPNTNTSNNRNPQVIYTPIPVRHIGEEELRNNMVTNNPFEVGQIIRLDNIYYDFDLAQLKAESMLELDKLVMLMSQNPGMEITIMSHTDSRGNADYNFDLSQRRAESVIHYLVSRNISRNRLKARGYGENKPINSCYDGIVCGDDEHAQNRRTEFQINQTGKPQPAAYQSGTDRLLSWKQ